MTKLKTAQKFKPFIVLFCSVQGYLSSMLAERCESVSVIAVEGNKDRIQSSRKINNCSSNSNPQFSTFQQVYVKLDVNMSYQLSEFITNSQKLCITGLHSCGDLTPWTMKTFLCDPKYDFLAIVPCCYHKMNSEPLLFPLSSTLKSTLSKLSPCETSVLTGLHLRRLGSQRLNKTFLSKMETETRCMFYRSLIELYCHKGYNPVLLYTNGLIF